MIFILDNYDSFTYNLVQAISAQANEVRVARNDRVSAGEILELKPDGVVFSPGPGRPAAAGQMPQIFAELAGRIPILGVCLGHQMIAEYYGGRVVPANRLVHGKASRVVHDGKGVFHDLPSPMTAGRYHSLAVAADSIPDCLAITAHAEDGEVMGIRHRELPIEGVQFHPESILTPDGNRLIANFLKRTCLASHNALCA